MEISKDIKDRLVDALISALVFAAALSWRETLVLGMQIILPDDVNDFWSELAVTGGITAIVLTIVYLLIKTSRVVDNTFHLDKDDDSGFQENEKQKPTEQKEERRH